ncbi:MAG TPA: hypothetical protein VF981_06705 [Gemmatimonadaceae bacterium]
MNGRRIEGNFNQGWGVAAFVILLAVAGFATAYTLKQRTYHSPNDVTAPAGGAVTHEAPKH